MLWYEYKSPIAVFRISPDPDPDSSRWWLYVDEKAYGSYVQEQSAH
jgi:hypothetical protein